MDRIALLYSTPRPPRAAPPDRPSPADGVEALEARLSRLRAREELADAALRRALAAARKAPSDIEAARRHIEAADSLADIANDRERTEDALIGAQRGALAGAEKGEATLPKAPEPETRRPRSS